MSQHSKVTATCLFVGVVILVTTCGRGEAAPTNCSNVACPAPLCANPTTPPGECCPSCRGSRCPLKGCVNRRPGGKVTWQPDPCTFCQCLDDRTICAAMSCLRPSPEDCLGYPVVTKPWECCPSCGFPFPADTCNVIPLHAGRRNVTVSDGSKACATEVTLSACDKGGYRAGGKKYQCMPAKGRRMVEFGDDCPLNIATFVDVVKCSAVQNDDIAVGCDMVVP